MALVKFIKVVLLILIFSLFVSLNSFAQEKKEYPTVGKSAGVWSDGQAALWDLNILDHYRLSGAEERARGYKPKQPIKFSHVTHVQKNEMDCQFCHWTVNKAAFAAIPEVETCMGCHKMIKGKTEEQKTEIAKIDEYYSKGEPIPWEKVHVMPDYLRFNHKRHVKGGISCQECHGQIPEMEEVERVSSMKMGWCVDCHREKGSSIDCAVCHR